MSRKGFTVVEMMIVLATIAVLAAILIPRVTDALTKRNALKLYDEVVNISTGVTEFYRDCGTYPKDDAIGLLWNKAWATAANTQSGIDPSTCWQGPYLDALPPNTLGYFYSPFGTGSQCTLITDGQDINGSGNRSDIYVKCTAIPKEAADILEKKIDGDFQDDFTSGDFLAQCSGNLCTVEMIIDEL